MFWIRGLIEDDPIPHEIKSLVFYVNENYEIGFSGTEKEKVEKIDLFFFYPLEAQYFYAPRLYENFFEQGERFALETLKTFLIQLKAEKDFSFYNLYYGKLYSFAKKI